MSRALPSLLTFLLTTLTTNFLQQKKIVSVVCHFVTFTIASVLPVVKGGYINRTIRQISYFVSALCIFIWNSV